MRATQVRALKNNQDEAVMLLGPLSRESCVGFEKGTPKLSSFPEK